LKPLYIAVNKFRDEHADLLLQYGATWERNVLAAKALSLQNPLYGTLRNDLPAPPSETKRLRGSPQLMRRVAEMEVDTSLDKVQLSATESPVKRRHADALEAEDSSGAAHAKSDGAAPIQEAATPDKRASRLSPLDRAKRPRLSKTPPKGS
jgi:hypothetical protein